ncbi:MAG: hypothetical protein KDD00_12685 [Ignavibacteriae bacterium]|nr:hypothetical protein [Ignavibacteriota bacterium]
MSVNLITGYDEYILHIFCKNNTNFVIGVSDKTRFISEDHYLMESKLVYFEIFSDRLKALRRKNYLTKLESPKKLRLIKKNNPDMLNLIFTIPEAEHLLIKS